MNWQDILGEEKRDSKEDLNKVFLHKEGNFVHAYEWSAFLIWNNFLTKNKEHFVVHRRKFSKFNEGIAYVGFPLASLSYYFPDASFGVSQDIIAEIGQNSIETKEITFEKYSEILKEWKGCFPLKENGSPTKEQEKRKETILGMSQKINVLLHEIADYQISNKSLLEIAQFLTDAQKRLRVILKEE